MNIFVVYVYIRIDIYIFIYICEDVHMHVMHIYTGELIQYV